jgi:phosphatidylserine/phosphatidylglycerophosphate/cardiolipin synthase-like enzyme
MAPPIVGLLGVSEMMRRVLAILGLVLVVVIALFAIMSRGGTGAVPSTHPRPFSQPAKQMAGPAKGIPPGIVPAALYVEPEAGVTPLTRLLDGAKKSIFVESYFLSDTAIIHALERAEAQGVKVNVLLDEYPLGLSSYTKRVYDELMAANIPVRWTASTFRFTHAKYMVIDDATAIISTANFSASAFRSNREVIAIVRKPVDVTDLSNLFRADWDRISPQLHTPDLIVSPINARADLTRLIASARHSIDIYDEEMQDPQIESLLTTVARKGVKVRVLLPEGAASGRHRPPESLLRVVKVRELHSPYVHAKVIMIDRGESYIGSENLSATSLDDNREVGVFLRGPLTSVQNDFNHDWDRAQPPA